MCSLFINLLSPLPRVKICRRVFMLFHEAYVELFDLVDDVAQWFDASKRAASGCGERVYESLVTCEGYYELRRWSCAFWVCY